MVLGPSALEDKAVSSLAKEVTDGHLSQDDQHSGHSGKRIVTRLMIKRKLNSDTIERILIRSTNWVGDAILTTPAVRAIRKNFPHAQISILAKPWVAPVFYHNPYADYVIQYDSERKHAGWVGKIRLIKELRRRRFDLSVLFQNAFEAALLARLAGIPNRLGYDTDARGALLTHPIHLEPKFKQIHEIDYYLTILKGAFLELDGRDLTIVVTDKERSRAEDILANYGVTGRDVLVGVNPGSTYGPAKRWPPERYAALCDKIQTNRAARIIIFGGSVEEATGRQISALMKHGCIDLCGRTTLREAVALIEKCQLFVTNDSGLMHVASAFDVPLVAIFGSTNPITTGPSSSRSRIIRVPVPCSPCLKPECPEDHSCMKEITIDQVYAAADALIAETSKGGDSR